jgi:hypothetical protein
MPVARHLHRNTIENQGTQARIAAYDGCQHPTWHVALQGNKHFSKLQEETFVSPQFVICNRTLYTHNKMP